MAILFGCGSKLGSNLGRVLVCHRGCAYTVLKTVEMSGMCSDVHGTVYYKELFELFLLE